MPGPQRVRRWRHRHRRVARGVRRCCEDGVRKTMREVAILEFDDGLIRSLREYWATEAIGPSTTSRQPDR